VLLESSDVEQVSLVLCRVLCTVLTRSTFNVRTDALTAAFKLLVGSDGMQKKLYMKQVIETSSIS
jgi:hypothetical protein